ncbi:YadA C-terminal domain-containing protein [Pseudovibrio sp. Tun.PSC04-5.I4]|uniref:YadA C-terminal domain-containing protein n=1 Tax=Pseudovibrio sp. Tun.PSC04-5.I4 TaxID=1798213 RepID=UPI0008905004|nr:YadA C-terminal domain-containing protein [Pseudovibrio sp. Tun.PSC04-5.I4]SDR48674.1 YadA-like C-terminal region [Pseudovibrio sp. Tun.PSC04-5.I4]
MTKLKLTYALAALMATTGLAQAGTITITTDGSNAITHYAGSSDNSGTVFNETTTTAIGSKKDVDKIFAGEINSNAQDIATNTQTINDFEMLFGSVQTTAPTPISSTVKDPLKTGDATLDDARTEVAKIDNNSTLKGEWETYINHVEAKAAAGEKITMEQPTAPATGDFIGGSIPTNMATKLSGLDAAVGNYASEQLPHESYSAYTKANGANASGRATAQALENGEGLATGILASFNAVDDKIGDISTLPSDLQAATPADTSVVSAVTKLNEKVGSLGDLNSTFTGTARTSLVAAANSNADRITANSDGIANNSTRIVALEEDVDDLQSGVAMAIAMANAPIIQGGYNGVSLSGGFGHFKGKSAGSMKAAFMPMENMAITASVATDFGDNVAAGAGLGFSF